MRKIDLLYCPVSCKIKSLLNSAILNLSPHSEIEPTPVFITGALYLTDKERSYIKRYSNYCDVYIYKAEAELHFNSATYDAALYKTAGNRWAVATHDDILLADLCPGLKLIDKCVHSQFLIDHFV